MADNINIKDKDGNAKVMAAKDISSVFYPKHIITDEGGEAASVTNNKLDVNDVNRITEIIDLKFWVAVDEFTLDGGISIGDVEFDVTAGHSIDTGQMVIISEDGRFFQAEVLTVDTNTITVDSPCNYDFTDDADCENVSNELNQNGSSSTVIARIKPPANVTWDITKLLFYMQDATAMDDSTFGGLSALTNGVVLRSINSVYNNIFNAKSNYELALQMFDVDYPPKPASGKYAFRGCRKFGGKSETGVVIRLDGDSGHELQLLIQDNLTGLEKFHCVVHGHVVE